MARERPSYPPPSRLHPQIDVYPRPLPPLEAPPANIPLPPLPSPVRNPVFTPSYILTTHLYPSAYPHAPSCHLPPSAYAEKPGETKEMRLKRVEQFVQDLWLKKKAQAEGGAPQVRKEILWNAVNRYVRNDVGKGRRGVTLFLAHANGMHKETWEPWLLRTFSHAKNAGVVIDEVWAFESVQHGDSALVNESVIGDIFDWADNARDILNFLIHYLPSKASPLPLPTHLPRIPDAAARGRQVSGFQDRTLVAIGHSLGGCSTLRAAIAYPSLFTSIVLVDPVILPRWAEQTDDLPSLSIGAVKRRASWSSRHEALSGFRKSPFFGAWDPAVLEKYVEHGLAPDPDGSSKDAVRLKMSGAQEAIVFMDRRVCWETWQLMPLLDERITLRFLLNGKDNHTTGGDDATRESAWRCRNSSNARIPSAGHLIVQEDPEALAEEAVEFLYRRHGLKASL